MIIRLELCYVNTIIIYYFFFLNFHEASKWGHALNCIFMLSTWSCTCLGTVDVHGCNVHNYVEEHQKDGLIWRHLQTCIHSHTQKIRIFSKMWTLHCDTKLYRFILSSNNVKRLALRYTLQEFQKKKKPTE